MTKYLKWLRSVTAGLAAEQALLLLAGAFPLSYLAAQADLWRKGVAVVFDAIPPLFWPILSVLVLLVIAGRVVFLRKERWRRQQELHRSKIADLGNKADKISRELRNSARPEMLTEEWQKTSNFPYMRDEAARAANLIAARLGKLTETERLVPERRCDAGDDESVQEWSDSLAKCAEALSLHDG